MAFVKPARRAPGVIASFVHVDAAAEAIRALRARGHRNLVVYSAAPFHEIEEALDHSVSPVRLFTLLGALSTVAAVALFTVLMGKRGIAYDPSFSDDHIGVFVPAGGDQMRTIEQLLRTAGAVEVRHEAA